MYTAVPIDRAFDEVTRRRDACRETVGAMTAAALAGVQAVERNMPLVDQKALAVKALKQDRSARLNDELRRVSRLTRMMTRLGNAKRLGAPQVWLSDDEMDLL